MAASKRSSIVCELATTESTYVNDLRVVRDVFVEPAEGFGLPDVSAAVFGNIVDIYDFHMDLASALEERCSDPETAIVSDLFLENVEKMKDLYSIYCSNHPLGSIALASAVAPFKAFVHHGEQDPQCRQLKLSSFLLTPVQRICKYPLLFRDLLKSTPCEHPDCEGLTRAVFMSQEIADVVNEAKRLNESNAFITELADITTNWPSDFDIRFEADRMHLCDETLTKINKHGKRHRRRIILFSDVILLVAESKNGGFSYRNRVLLSEADIEDGDDDRSILFCRHDKRRRDKLIFDTARDKRIFLEHFNVAQQKWVEQGKALTVSDLFAESTSDSSEDDDAAEADEADADDSRKSVVINDDGLACDQLNGMLRKLRGPNGIQVRDHRRWLNTYHDAFSGAELVDWIVANMKKPESIDGAEHRRIAVDLGRQMLARKSFWPIKSKAKSRFADDNTIYQFELIGVAADGCGDVGNEIDTFTRDDNVAPVVAALKEGLEIKDRRYRLMKYKRCFLANECINLIVNSFAVSRSEALSMGEKLIRLEHIEHVAGKTVFEDGHFFYRFVNDNGSSGPSKTMHDFTVKDIDNKDVPLSIFQGKAVIIVNVASYCGLTDTNYKQLTDLHKRLSPFGLEVLAFPCNQFGDQERKPNEEIKQFAEGYGARFFLGDKIHVNGPKTCELYKWLKSEKKGKLGRGVKWNFAKFLVGPDGKVVDRFIPTTDPSKIEPHVMKLLTANN